MRIVRTMEEARRTASGVVGLVPTMGSFHEGHLSLMERSTEECDHTVVSLFVNPLQFNDPDDLDRYPTDHERDTALADEAGVDVVVIPSLQEMYPQKPLTRVSVAEVGHRYEGAYRPGHLSGVATAVTKLFAGLQPDRAYFGRKDAQQLAMVRRMTSDLSFPVEVVGCPLIRASDGLALSSRNLFLGDDRATALGLSSGLFAAADAVEAGERRSDHISALVGERGGEIELQYVAVADRHTMQPVPTVQGDTVLLAAAMVGSIRLIDNVAFRSSPTRLIADRGQRLEQPSMMSRTEDYT